MGTLTPTLEDPPTLLRISNLCELNTLYTFNVGTTLSCDDCGTPYVMGALLFIVVQEHVMLTNTIL